MPGYQAAVEDEMLFNGGDERAAKSITLENPDGGMAEIVRKLREAEHVDSNSKAA